MNENMRMNEHGLRLLIYFEKGPPTVPLSRDGGALEPYVCPGGKLTIGYGCTKWFDGSSVMDAHRLSGEDDARALLMQQLVEYEEAVRNLAIVELNSNQFSALVAFSFNCGIRALAGSTVLRETNARRWEDAAAAFGMWIFATAGEHKQALRGLLRRRYAEAATFMGYRFEEACDDDAIALQRLLPEGDPPKGTDRVTYKTPFLEVLRVAQHYPLPALDESPEPVQAVSPVPAPMEQAGAKSSPAATDDSGTLVLTKDMQAAREASPVAAGGAPQVTSPAAASPAPVSNSASAAESRPAPGSSAPPPSPSGAGASTFPKFTPKQTPPIATIQKPPSRISVPITDAPYRIDPNLGLKPLEDSERWQASLAQNGGMVLMRLARYGFMGAGPATVATYVEKDPIFSGAFLALIGVGVMFSVGYVRKSYGDWRRHHAERVACQALV